jgi:hypothetical protein
LQVLVLIVFLVSPPMVTAPEKAPQTASVWPVVGESLLGAALGTGLSLVAAQGLAGWSNDLVGGLAPSVLIGALGPGLSGHFSLRRSARKKGLRLDRPLLAASAAGLASALAFTGLVMTQQSSGQALGVVGYLTLGTALPVVAQWWALEPSR